MIEGPSILRARASNRVHSGAVACSVDPVVTLVTCRLKNNKIKNKYKKKNVKHCC